MTLCTTAMYMVCFSYVGAVVTGASSTPDVLVPIALLLFGIGAFVGLGIGGRTADRHPYRTKVTAILGAMVVIVGLMIGAESGIAVTLLCFPLGLCGFMLNPAVMARVFTVAGDAPTLVSAVNVAAMQLGITLAPVLGGVMLGLGGGFRAAFATGLAWGACALVVLVVAERSARDASRSPMLR